MFDVLNDQEIFIRNRIRFTILNNIFRNQRNSSKFIYILFRNSSFFKEPPKKVDQASQIDFNISCET